VPETVGSESPGQPQKRVVLCDPLNVALLDTHLLFECDKSRRGGIRRPEASGAGSIVGGESVNQLTGKGEHPEVTVVPVAVRHLDLVKRLFLGVEILDA